jgi:hypothetical protein
VRAAAVIRPACPNSHTRKDQAILDVRGITAASRARICAQCSSLNSISGSASSSLPGELVCADGRYMEGETERRAAIFIGPEFRTVLRAGEARG